MSSTWRLLNTRQNNASMNMAIDEAILLTQRSSPQPTLRFYDWMQPTFSFGYFQQITNEVDMTACTRHKIELVRRMTGGGTVVHGWDVTYTVIVPHGSGILPKDISAAYRVLSDCVINGLERLDIDAKCQLKKPTTRTRENSSAIILPNICLTNTAQYDVMLNEKKIAGVSQRRNQISVMYQGYIALNMPTPNVLALASKRLNLDQVVAGKSGAINVERSTPIYRKQLEDAITNGFEDALGIRLVEGQRFPQEIETAEFLVQTKYATAEWNFRR